MPCSEVVDGFLDSVCVRCYSHRSAQRTFCLCRHVAGSESILIVGATSTSAPYLTQHRIEHTDRDRDRTSIGQCQLVKGQPSSA